MAECWGSRLPEPLLEQGIDSDLPLEQKRVVAARLAWSSRRFAHPLVLRHGDLLPLLPVPDHDPLKL